VKPKRIWPAIAVSVTIVVLAGCGQTAHSAASSPQTSAGPSLGSPGGSSTSSSQGTDATSADPSKKGAACVTSSGKGTCGPYGYADITGSIGSDTFVLNNMWAANNGTTQTLTAYGPGRWSVVAHAGPAGNTSVQTYPDTQQIYTQTDNSPDPLSSFGSILSSFTENMHATRGTSAEAAYDMWLGQSSSTNYADEVMIWNDQANRGTCGGATVKAHATFGGSKGVPRQNWTLCVYGGSELIWYLTSSNERGGVVNILSMLTWLESHGYIPAGSGLNQIDYGFEICSTPGPETFTLSQFAIKSTCHSGASC
jgi:hypothetical protein